MKKEVNPASSAAPRAGTTWKASVCASSAISGATSTPSPPATTQASTVFMIARRLGDRPTSIAATSFSDAARVDRPNGVQRYSAASSRRHDDHDPREQEAVDRHDAVEDRDRVGRQDRRRRLQAVAEDHDHPRLQHEQEAERRGQLGERRRVPERAEDGQLDQDAERGHADERQDEGRRGREVKAEVAGLERPEDVCGEHRDRAGGDVDHAGAPVDEDDAERDARDQRTGAESQRCEEEDVLHPSSVSQRAGGPGSCRARRVPVVAPTSTPGGFSQPEAGFHLPLPT